MASLKNQHFLKVIVFNGLLCKDRLSKTLLEEAFRTTVLSVCVIRTGSAELTGNEDRLMVYRRIGTFISRKVVRV